MNTDIHHPLSLEARETLLRLVEQSDALFVHDHSGNFIDFNAQACNSLGYNREELSRMSVVDVDIEFDLARAQAAWNEMQPNKLYTLTGCHRRKDGSTFPVEIRLGCFDQNGERFFMGMARDISERMLAEQRDREQQERIVGLIDAAMDAVVSADENQNIVLFNHAAEQMFGYLAADIIGRPLDLLIPSRFRNVHLRHVDQFGKTGVSRRSVNRQNQSFGLRANGDEFPFEASISRAVVAGKVMFTAIVRDISLRKQTEAALHLAAAAFDTQEGMIITDTNGVILRVNKAFTRITGYSAEEVVGQTPRLLKSGRHDADFYREMWDTLKRTGAWQGEVWDRRKSGEIYPKWLMITAVRGKDGSVTHYIGSQTDISERKAAEEQIHTLAFYDPLTRLPNRRLLDDRLAQSVAASKRSGRYGAAMFIDLDNFKPLNDVHGHKTGDLLLVEVARRLAGCVREVDTVARFGGDEFVVLVGELDEDRSRCAVLANNVAEKIRTSLSEPYWLTPNPEGTARTIVYRDVGASLGVTLYGSDACAESVLKWADKAMYQAKEAGRNRICFYNPDT